MRWSRRAQSVLRCRRGARLSADVGRHQAKAARKRIELEQGTEDEPVVPDPSPFVLPGGSIGVLLIHGFNSSASSMRPLGHYLHQRGIAVSAPLLPGHGTRFENLRSQRRTDWTCHVEEAWSDLKSHCEVAFVVGQSLGALLTLDLAARRTDVNGAILLSVPISIPNSRRYLAGIARYVVPYVSKQGIYYADSEASGRNWQYDRVSTSAMHEVLKLRRETIRVLPSVTCPILLIHSKKDSVVNASGARHVYDRVGSEDRQLLLLERSGHVLSLDSEWPVVAARIHRFINDCLPSNMRSHA